MTLEARKIAFVQEFLRLQSEEAIGRFEEIMRKEEFLSEDSIVDSMTENELNKRIDQSELDFSEGRFKRSEELLTKYE